MAYDINLGPVAHDNRYLRSSLGNALGDLKIGHFNCQSFCTSSRSSKLDEIRHILQDRILDVVGVSETWLKSTISSNVVSIPGYTLYRSDRPGRTRPAPTGPAPTGPSPTGPAPTGPAPTLPGRNATIPASTDNGVNGRRAGGVGLYVSNSLKCRKVFHSKDFGIFESIFIEINGSESKWLLGVVYLPHGDINVMEDRLSDLLVKYENIVIMGDFNLNLFDMNNSQLVRSTCQRLGLTCFHNNLPTHYTSEPSTSLLDFFMLSPSISIQVSGQMQCPAISHHSFIYISVSVPLIPNEEFVEFRDYNRVDLNILQQHVLLYDFSSFYENPNVDNQLSNFMECVNHLHSLVPIRKYKISPANEKWFNTPLINYHLSLRDLAFKEYLRVPSRQNWRCYCKARNRSKTVIRNAKRMAHTNKFKNLDTSGMWKLLRSNGCLNTDDPVEGVNPDELNMEFSNNRSVDSFDPFDSDLNFCSDGFSFRNIDFDDLRIALFNIKSNASGSDELPLKFIKIIFPFIHRQLLYLINNIITNSMFPSDWKIAKVIPIRKKESRLEFRPISLVPVMSKIVEHIIKDQVMMFLNQNNLLNSFQSGFRAGHSTTSLLIGLTDSIRRIVDRDNVGVLLSLDLSKAFDNISHAILIRKLCNYFGFSFSACKLIYSYLSGRRQFVHCNDSNSECLAVTSGVPQGSVIGPLLFMLYMNDFFTVLRGFECDAFVFADDIQLLFSGHLQLIDVFEYDINLLLSNISAWMNNSSLSINSAKTKAMLFKPHNSEVDLSIMINGEHIEFVEVIKCLGVLIDKNLEFSRHINGLSCKINFTLRRLYSLNLYLPLSIRKRIAHSLLMSNLLYCIEVYSGCSVDDFNRCNLLFNKIIRFVYKLRSRDHVSSNVLDFLGCDFKNFVRIRLLLFYHKVMLSNCPEYLRKDFILLNTERNPQLLFPIRNYIIHERSFHVRVARYWNYLPIHLRSFDQSLETFKCKLLEYASVNDI